MIKKYDMIVYDERKRYPTALYILAITFAGPFIYLAVTKVILMFMTVKYQCLFAEYSSTCDLNPKAAPIFTSLSLLHKIYGRIAEVKPELRYLQMILYIAGVIIAFLPFALRNYRAGFREFFLLAFLASGALCTLLVKS